MRRILTYLSIFLIVSCTGSKTATTDKVVDTVVAEKLDRSKPPAPGPAPVIQLGDYKFFQLDNGLKVYVVENDKLPRVSYSLRIDRDPIFEGEKAGYVSVTGDLMSRGTTSKTKAEIDEAIDFIGASFSTSSRSMFGSSLTKHSRKVLEIMKDVLMNPSFPQDELDKIVKLMNSNLEADKDDPAAIVGNIRALAIYGKDHPYGEMLSEASLESITRDDVIGYYKEYWSPKKAYMAVVGDITVEEARKNVESYFGEWNGSDLPENMFKQPQLPEQTTVVLVDRPQSVQSEIRVSYAVDYKTGDEDFFAARMMNQILGGGMSSRLMQNLREDKAYTYSAGSGLSTNELIGRFSAGASVRNEVTDSAVHEFLSEMDKIANEGVTEGELAAEKAYLTGQFARSLESPQTIAGFAINSAIKDLPDNFYQDYLKNLNAVTLEEVNAAARKFIKPENAYVVVVGKAEEIEEKLKAFGPVVQYDVEGNLVDKGKLNAALAGMSPEAVIDKYITAVGGVENMKKVSNQRQTWAISAYGQTMNVNSVKTADGKFRTDVEVGGQVQQSIVCNGKNVITMAMGQTMPMDEATTESEIINNRLFPELYYSKSGVKLKLSGIEKVNGEDAYMISIIYPSGKESQAYFAVKSGLKVKEATSVDTPQGTFTQVAVYKDYNEIDGILYSHINTIQMGPQSVESKMISLENNTKITDDTFAME